MRKAEVYYKKSLAGYLIEENYQSYVFQYTEAWLADVEKPAISLTLPKNKEAYRDKYLFPFFCSLTSEGANRELQSKFLRIDEKDNLGFLLETAEYDTIGAVTVKQIEV
jgi:HipA-like protein